MSFEVPVILIFTKFDALDAIAFTNLEREGKAIEEAESEAPQRAREEFEKYELPRFMNHVYRPNGIVCLRSKCTFSLWMLPIVSCMSCDPGMHMDGQVGQCSKIIELTAENLDDQTLKVLLISVQQANLKLKVKYALER
jgi:hypothetical protein